MNSFFGRLFGAARQPPHEYDDFLRLTFESQSPPHQILVFCYNLIIGMTPDEMVEQFTAPGVHWTLGGLAGNFTKLHYSDLISRSSLEKRMKPFLSRLALTLDNAVREQNWRDRNPDILEIKGQRTCGATHLIDYASGRVCARITAWDAAVKNGHMENKGELLSAAAAAGFAPYVELAYLLRSVLGRRHEQILTLAGSPLREVAAYAEQQYGASRGGIQAADACCFERLRESLGKALGQVPHLSKTFTEDFRSQMHLTIGGMRLEDFATPSLADDISSWSWSVRRNVVKKLLTSAKRGK